MKKILAGLLIGGTILSAANQDLELKVYTAQKYKADYSVLDAKNKENIKSEYLQLQKLNEAIADEIKNEAAYKVASSELAVNIWSRVYMAKLQVSEKELKELYEKEKTKILSKYKLRNILVRDEKTADEIYDVLSKTDKFELITKFSEFVKKESDDINTRRKEGQLGWIDFNKLDKPLQDLLKDKNKNDIVKIKQNQLGWQIILIEEFQPERKATFEESKQYLNNFYRQQKLNQEIQKILSK